METKIEIFYYFRNKMVFKNMLPSSRKAPFIYFILLKQIKWIENPSHKREHQTPNNKGLEGGALPTPSKDKQS
jgi:hypothetical protein